MVISKPVRLILRAVSQVYMIKQGDPSHLHLPVCKKLLIDAQRNLNGCTQAIRELEMAIEDLDYYCRDQVTYYKSGEFFLQHTGMAILVVLGLV